MTQSHGPVLLAYDGAESSATAITVAGRLLPGREALVCHAWTGVSRVVLHGAFAQPPAMLTEAIEELDQVDRQEAEETAAAGAQLAEAAGFKAKPLTVREESKTWRTLLQVAQDRHVSLIVAGAHGMSGIGRTLLGSVSTGLVHHSDVPVLVVPATARDEDTDGPVLLCYDGSDAARRAISVAGELLDSQPALVLHFWQSWVAEAPALASLSRSVEGMAAELDEVADEQSSKLTADGLALAEQSGFDPTGFSERAVGPGWIAVRDAANKYACAAIVIGSRGLTGVSAALGSVSNGVVHIMNGVAPANLAELYRVDWVKGDDAIVSQLRGDTALVEEQFSKTHDVQVGERFRIETPSGGTAQLKAIGVYRDPQLLQGTIVPQDLFARVSAARDPWMIFAATRDGVNADTAKKHLTAALADIPTAAVESQADYADAISGQLDQFVYLLYALLAMSVVISLFGIANSLFLSIHERTREFGLLRAVGATKAQVRQMVRYESVITAVIGGLLGTAIGVLFALLVTSSLDDLGLGFDPPLRQLGIFLLLAIAVGVIAAVVPARRGARMQVLDALRAE